MSFIDSGCPGWFQPVSVETEFHQRVSQTSFDFDFLKSYPPNNLKVSDRIFGSLLSRSLRYSSEHGLFWKIQQNPFGMVTFPFPGRNC